MTGCCADAVLLFGALLHCGPVPSAPGSAGSMALMLGLEWYHVVGALWQAIISGSLYKQCTGMQGSSRACCVCCGC
jgi:hypothetical protein